MISPPQSDALRGADTYFYFFTAKKMRAILREKEGEL